MAASEDQPEPVVFDPAVITAGPILWCRQHRRLSKLGSTGRGPPQPVERAVACRRRQPRTGTARDAVAGPMLERPREGVLRAFLGQVPVPGDPDEGGDDPSPLVPEGIGDGGLDGRYISQIGLTSMLP